MTLSATSPLIRQLFAANLIDEQALKEGLQKHASEYATMPEFLIAEDFIKQDALANFCYKTFSAPLLDIDTFDISTIPDDLITESLMRKHQIVPLAKKGRHAFVALADPSDFQALEDFAFNSGMQTEPIVVEHQKLMAVIERVFDRNNDNLDISDLDVKEFGELELENTDQLDDDPGVEKDDAPIIVYINKILMDAIRKGASDLHFEPYEKMYRIRFRIDGILHEVARPPITLSTRLSARLKVMSKLNIAEKRLPQDGRIKLKITKKKSIDFRVSTCPTLWGEKIVMRILDSSSAMLGIEVLGYEPEQQKLYLDALAQPQGMILVTGPTGSGKTVSLYTGLNILNTEATNISTAEDPVEINLPGINQVHINNKAGLDFPAALRSFLRQDPDVVMVGEIRDLETAEIAIKAAQTGHLVLSTLHTNSAPETLTRLSNMGVPTYNTASTVSLVIAQRLARRLCALCKEPEMLPSIELNKQGFNEQQRADMILYKPIGCDHCTNGYKGRVGIYQVMPISETMSKIIMQNGNAIEIAEQAKLENIPDLRESALLKAANGLTSLSEVNRVTKAQHQ
ncbi:MAG: type IV pilus assembly protein PilB [Phenylobacterium sp.]|jgi:type IV pilus assembly protein PilB